jgi:hypothetical protein
MVSFAFPDFPLSSKSSAHFTPQKGHVSPVLEFSGTTCLHFPHTLLAPVWPKLVSTKTSNAQHAIRHTRFMDDPLSEAIIKTPCDSFGTSRS